MKLAIRLSSHQEGSRRVRHKENHQGAYQADRPCQEACHPCQADRRGFHPFHQGAYHPCHQGACRPCQAGRRGCHQGACHQEACHPFLAGRRGCRHRHQGACHPFLADRRGCRQGACHPFLERRRLEEDNSGKRPSRIVYIASELQRQAAADGTGCT
eukprot:Mycagemm_TRINITY_DN10069_c0_g1::TRINITY_DN10069_c0_g1_i1::g.2251::m.2251 type:complete len:157 gc:universal TRINITY_DN10069_c0_g1_i1:90-560(+)